MREARKKGQIPRTPELATALILLAVFGVLSVLGSWFNQVMMGFTRAALEGELLSSELSIVSVHHLLLEALATGVLIGLPIAGVVVACALIANFAQVGISPSGEGLKVKFSHISPVSGFKRIFSRRALVEFAKSLIKFLVVAYVAYVSLKDGLAAISGMPGMPLFQAVALTAGMVYRTGLYTGLALLVLAGFDYAYQRWENRRSLRMTRREVEEEMKQTEGDPKIRARIRKRQREMAMQRMMQSVPEADVVITNPTHFAVALRYEAGRMKAPEVVAKGAGPLAQRIKEIANEHSVAVVENPPLARALYDGADVGSPVPEELYQGVAEVLAFVYRLKTPGGQTRSQSGAAGSDRRVSKRMSK